jgi:predicted CoA-binding protein
MMSGRTVVVLGASPKEDRYANMAMRELKAHGEKAVPVNPAFEEILGEKCYASISEVPGPIDTVTLYLGAARSSALMAEITAARPRRIIMNPGAENEELTRMARAEGVEVVHGCTLVMLRIGTF